MKDGSFLCAVSVGKFLRRKCSQVPLGVEGFLSDERTLFFGHGLLSEPLEFSAYVTTEGLGEDY